MRSALFVLGIVIVLSSCSHVISKELRQSAVDLPFGKLKEDIERYKGSIFIWGGFIVETKPTEEGTLIEVVQNPIGRYGGVIDKDTSEGRFLALYRGRLDPLIYRKNRQLTVGGKLLGSVEKPLEGVYPLIEIKELHLWKEEVFYYQPFYLYWYWDPPNPYYQPP